jgi:hypothetical protein
MRTVARIIIIAAGSLGYWIYAPLVPFGLRELLFPECYASSNPQACQAGASITQVGGFVAIGVIYSFFLWRALRLFR